MRDVTQRGVKMPDKKAKSTDKKFYEQWWFFAITGLVIIASISQLSSGVDDSATPAPTVTVTEDSGAIPTAVVTANEIPHKNNMDSGTNSDSSSTIEVPDAVGKDYQTAQDLWRTAGLTVMPAEDALGLDRIPLIDSNWVVVSQEPQAGSVVGRNSTITATVKKFTD